MSKIIMLKGLPGSGKTTWAKQYQQEHPNTKRVNRDELRAMLDDSVWSKPNETFVVEQEEFLITCAMMRGYDVIIDDTNLAPKNENRWKQLVTNYNENVLPEPAPYEFEIKEFTTSLEECIRRDSNRKGRAHVGKGVIMNFYQQFYANKDTTQ